MKGNFQVRFLGEGAVVMPLPYPTRPGSSPVPTGRAGQGRQAGLVVAAGSGANATLGMATWGKERIGVPYVGNARADRSDYQRQLHLCQQAVLPRNDELRGGEVLPDKMRCPLPRWQPRRLAVRDAVPVAVARFTEPRGQEVLLG